MLKAILSNPYELVSDWRRVSGVMDWIDGQNRR